MQMSDGTVPFLQYSLSRTAYARGQFFPGSSIAFIPMISSELSVITRLDAGSTTPIWVSLGTAMTIFWLAPSIDSMQEMLKTCQYYAEAHNLKFSTNVNPNKCKTKCIAFLYKERILDPLMLCGDPLPWVGGGVHLGNHLCNKMEGMRQDVKVKRANFISKNIELNQEFSFSHPLSKVKINLIYNFHFTGSQLWDLFSREATMLENSWNTAVKVMFDLPVATHRFLIEPVSETRHLKSILIDRFLSFLQQIEKSRKNVPKHLLAFIKYDVRSTTGSNLRNILHLTNLTDIKEITRSNMKELKYQNLDTADEWKVAMIKEITDIKFNQLEVDNFNHDELQDILEFLCTT